MELHLDKLKLAKVQSVQSKPSDEDVTGKNEKYEEAPATPLLNVVLPCNLHSGLTQNEP